MRCLSLSILAMLCGAALATSTGAQSSSNGSDVDNTPLNPPDPGAARAIQRLLSAPRIDATTPMATHIGLHRRLYDLDVNGLPDGNFRESIQLWRRNVAPAMGFSPLPELAEGDTPPDFDGQSSNGELDNAGLVWGGEAYVWEGLFVEQYFTSNDFDLSQNGEQNTFGGLTIGGGDTDNPHFAFFAGLISEDQAMEMDLNGRSGPPRVDIALNGPKPTDTSNPPVVRGIWSTFGTYPQLYLRAIEASSTHRAPGDPDATRGFSGAALVPFQRLHYSDYDLSQDVAFRGSWFGEQRFGQIGNLSMNANGALSFRADLSLQPDNPRPGIWADQIVPPGVPVLHRVFMRHVSNNVQEGGIAGQLWLDFLNTGSTDQANHPNILYRIMDVGVPAMTNGATPTVFAYAMLNATETGSGIDARKVQGSTDLLEQVAIIARKVGTDAANLDGFREQIIAIEGEPFTVRNSPYLFEFKIAQGREDGFPGLADLPASQDKFEFKTRSSSSPNNLHAFHPRPSINNAGKVAFLGVLGSAQDSQGMNVLTTHPLESQIGPGWEALVCDEGVYTTRGNLGSDHFERVAFEGDLAPVRRNGALLANTYFAPSLASSSQYYPASPDPDAVLGDEIQTFSQPLINYKGEIVFMGAWVHDPDPESTTDALEAGRSIFVSRGPGHLECLVSTGDETVEEFRVPGQNPEDPGIKGVHEFQFCTLAVPENVLAGQNVVGHASWTDCGLLTFTSRLKRQDNNFPLGWGLFIYNTAEPTGEGATPRGPQLIVKTSVGSVSSDDTFDIGLPDSVIIEHQHWYHSGISVGVGAPGGGDATLHPDGSVVFAINPDGGQAAGVLVLATPELNTLDFDSDGKYDGCDNCPIVNNEFQADADNDGVGNACDPCPTDLNGDGVVDGMDLAAILSFWGPDCAGVGCPDLDNDGDVDGEDLAALLAAWGQSCTEGASAQQSMAAKQAAPVCSSCFCTSEANCTEFGVTFGPGPDYNLDGVVDIEDLRWMAKALYMVGDSRFDMNKDGIVDAVDLLRLLDAFTEGPFSEKVK